MRGAEPGDATVLVEALGGDISVGTAIAFDRDVQGPADRYGVHALMPDGTRRPRRLNAARTRGGCST